MAVKKITEYTMDLIEKGTVKTLPDDPSRAGYSPDVIKRRMYQANRKVMEEINAIVEQINSELEDILMSVLGVSASQIHIGEEPPTNPNIIYWGKTTNRVD